MAEQKWHGLVFLVILILKYFQLYLFLFTASSPLYSMMIGCSSYMFTVMT